MRIFGAGTNPAQEVLSMNRFVRIGATAAAAALLAVSALAASPRREKSVDPARGYSPGYGMMGGGMMGCRMCGGMMGRTSMVAMGNNLYIMAGNKILKYDANLNLVKETEIKWDMEGMMKMHQKMMENCPMRQQMMQKPPMTK
jgi:hypothetical protein